MANTIFRGDAVAVAQIVKVTPANVETGDVFTLTINGKSISFTATAATVANVVDGLVAAWNASTIAEFAEITAAAVDSDSDDASDYLTLTADTAGKPFALSASTSNNAGGNLTIVEAVKGVAGVNERQKIQLIGSYSGGTFTLTWDPGGGDETTSALAYNASAATVQAALEALTTPTAGDFVVTGSAGGPWYVSFQGTYAQTDVNLMSVDGTNLTGGGSVDVDTTTPGAASCNEVQSLNVGEYNGSTIAGTYTLTFDGETTSALAYNASAATIQAALEALGTIGSGNVSVTGGQGVPEANDVGTSGAGTFGDSWYFTIEFIGSLAGTNVSEITVDDSGIESGSGEVTIETLLTGGVSTAELQLVNLDTPTAGTYTLTYDGQTTSALTWDANTTTIRTALQALSNLTLVYVRGHAGMFAVRFDGDAGTNVAAITINSVGLTGASSPTVTTIVEGASTSGTNEVQTVTIYGTGGTFTLTFDGQTTGSIAWNASAGTVETAIEALSNVTNVTVTGSGTPAAPYVVTFVDPGGQDVAEMTGDASSLTGGGGSVTTITAAVAEVDEQQTITIGAAVTGGTFTLTFDGEETSDIAYNASAGTVETALEALSTIDGVTVSGSSGGPWTVTFDSALLGNQDVALIVGDGSNLTGGAGTETLSITTTQRSLGPAHYDDPDNWTGGAVPNTDDTVHFHSGSQDCLYGLNQLTTFTANASTDTLTVAGDLHFVDDQKLNVVSSDTLPAGLSAGTDYYVINSDRDAGTLQLSTSEGGSAVNITDAGTGTHTIAAVLTKLEQNSRYTGKIGLPERTATGYYEYRATYLAIGATTVELGGGDGSGSGRIKLNTGPFQTTVKIFDTGGSSEAGLPAVIWKGTHSSNDVTLIEGDLGCGILATETATIDALVMRSGAIYLGTVTIASIERTGGEIFAENVTLSGSLIIRG